MLLRRNILASYVSQIYVTLIGIVLLPLYIQHMGAETYGLVGFFAMLQVWFNLLDLGLTPTVARETARHQGGALSAIDFRRLVHALESVFAAIGLVGGLVLLLAAEYIASHWLRVDVLPKQEVIHAVQLMACIIVLRWIGGLYRSIINGAQHLAWLSAFNIIAATARFAGVIPLLIYVGATPTLFFAFQLCIAICEFAILVLYCYRLMPAIDSSSYSRWTLAPLKPILKFSMGIAFTSIVWALVTQTDKLVLSRLLPLAEYGYFSLAVLIASGIMLLSAPVSAAIMPRMAKLDAEGDQQGLIRVYRRATQLVSVLAGSAAVTLAFCAEPLLWAWTGDKVIAAQAAPILTLYALGNGVLAVAAFPFYLQYAKGDLRLHLIGNAVFVVLLLPIIIWAASHYGAIGAGYAWLGMNLLSLIAWLPLVHRKYQPGLNRQWYGQDILIIFFGSTASALLLHLVWPETENRWFQLIQILVTGAVSTFSGGIFSTATRGYAAHLWQRWRKGSLS
jgi:O-antigen/teichoic acid export membrane protein